MTTNRDLDSLDLAIHRLVGGWAIDYRVLMPQGALDVIEEGIRALILAERERAASLAQTYGDRELAAVIRSDA